MTSDLLERAVAASLSDKERVRAVVYVSDRVLEPGEEVEVNGGRVPISASTVLAFADLEPGVNWGHRSRYLLIDADSGAVRAIDAQFPPFLRGMPPEWRVAYRSPSVPDWAIAQG